MYLLLSPSLVMYTITQAVGWLKISISYFDSSYSDK